MKKINIGLIGYGVVGQGVVKLLRHREDYIRNKYNTEFVLKTLCDRSIHKKNTRGLAKTKLTRKYQDVFTDPSIDVVIELIGGLRPSKEIISQSLKRGKHVVTANKDLIAYYGKELFELARRKNRHLYLESTVGAGLPVIKTIAEGLAGNKFDKIYGIINGTCNFILTEMTDNDLSFTRALEVAQRKGFAESNPDKDIKGIDSVYKLAILAYLAFGKFLKVDDIYTEGITHISHVDIEHAESLNLCIKLLAIAKKEHNMIEARVTPTLISKDHPLASIKSNYNAVYLDSYPMGNILLSGQGAGQLPAASGIISDLINFAAKGPDSNLLSNIYSEATDVGVRKIDEVRTKFYMRFMAVDKPGVLSQITGILGRYGVGINSVTQKQHMRTGVVPVVMLTDYATEKLVRRALAKIYMLPLVKTRPVAIRMEKLL